MFGSPGTVALRADGLKITSTAGKEILHGVSFNLVAGKIRGLVGESGSGKTTAGLACMGHFRAGLLNTGGSVALYRDGEVLEVLSLNDAGQRKLRGGSISYVPQDPSLSLNPAMRVGEQIMEVLRIHRPEDSERDRRGRITEVLAEVGLRNDKAYQRRYPHQLSGGQQQRIGIAMAFACRPAVMILDEPTTGLDVTTQAMVLKTIGELTRRHAVASLYITHDLAVVAELADDVTVMLRGDVVEDGPAKQVLYSPQHAYTRRLIRAVPDLAGRHRIGEVNAVTGAHPIVTAAGPIVDAAHPIVDAAGTGPGAPQGPASGSEPVSGTRAGERAGRHALPVPHDAAPATDNLLNATGIRLNYGPAQVLDGVDLHLGVGESLMLLGESGSGKTTLARCLAGLNDRYQGNVSLSGTQLQPGARQRSITERQRIQYVFQSPFSSLNPRRTIGESVAVPLQMAGQDSGRQQRAKVLEVLDQVKLGAGYIDRRPGELSGGERQRAAIARALVNAPSVLVCDEVTSALDVSVQAAIIDLLRTLQVETGMAMLFVTHNIALARHISQRMAVLQKGRIVDVGPTDDVLDHPQSDYTRELITNVPTL
ncbi:ABC transporter ATP-binding protein [Paeniglutamicibacter antarcticus]|uniref:ABC transporter ATP-binding protein n=1 Tax=Arthrobacter terrae TaxID=2935737 RepID=A0A931CRX2_9MICC|nr:ABC transporter ATP-binding protein [Arthrobacter terrae]MBG0738533.1 ABC transporter ATP-binding protein [Arthrobacter terrae]